MTSCTGESGDQPVSIAAATGVSRVPTADGSPETANPTAPHDAPAARWSTSARACAGSPVSDRPRPRPPRRDRRTARAARAAQQLARRQRARRPLVCDQQHALALPQAHDPKVLAVCRSTPVVGGHPGHGGDGPPLRPGLVRSGLGTALHHRATEGGRESVVHGVVEQGEGRAVRGAVGGETMIHPT